MPLAPGRLGPRIDACGAMLAEAEAAALWARVRVTRMRVRRTRSETNLGPGCGGAGSAGIRATPAWAARTRNEAAWALAARPRGESAGPRGESAGPRAGMGAARPRAAVP